MAQLACGVVGAVAGAYFGPVGAQIGFALGSAIGGLLFAPDQPTREGPRLAELDVSGSTYGLAIPMVRGVVRLPGNLIWSTGLKETRSKSKVGGKGGMGGGSKVVSYGYSASFAVAFCQGPADRLLRLWLDNTLAYDVTPREGGGAPADGVAIEGLAIRFYKGDEEQLPDPAMAAALPEGECPAHRGLCYAVVEDLDLARFGNRIPTVSAEVAHRSETKLTRLDGENLDPAASPLSPFASVDYQAGLFAADWERGLLYRGVRGPLKADPTEWCGLAVVDLATMREIRHVALRPGAGVFPCLVADQGGDVFWAQDQALLRLDGETLAEKGVWGEDPPAPAGPYPGVGPYGPKSAIDHLAVNSAIDPTTGLPAVFVLGVTGFGNPFVVDAELMGPIWGTTEDANGQAFPPETHPERLSGHALRLVAGEVQQIRMVFWLADSDDDGVRVHKLRMQYAGHTQPDTVKDAEWTPRAYRIPNEAIAPGLGAAAGRFEARGLDHHADDDALLFRSARRVFKWSPADGVAWTRAPSDAHDGFLEFGHGPSGASRIVGQYLGTGGEDATMFDLATGQAVFREKFPGGGTLRPHELWDGLGWRLVAVPPHSGGPVSRLDYNRAAGKPDSLAGVVSDLCALAGLGASRIDASELADDRVEGAVFGQQTVRDGLVRLQPAYLFDCCESAGKLVFRKRGRAPVASIPYDALLRPGPDEPALREARAQELELPRRATVRYRDKARDQLQGAQSWARPLAPTPTVGSVAESSIDLPLVMDADRAKAIARAAVVTAWTERTSFDGVPLPLSFLALEPADVVELGTRDGGALRVRLDKLDIGADFSLRARGVTEAPAAYSLAAKADPGDFPRPAVASAANAALFWPDLPLLADGHDARALGMRSYAGALPLAGAWTGGSLFLASDGVSWSRQAEMPPAGLAWGYAASALPAPASPWTWDDANALAVAPVSGADRFEAATDAEVLDGANGLALLLPGGRVEVLQFARCVHNADGTVTLSRLLRGRRGTEDACGLATAGAAAVLLEADALEPLVLPHAARGSPRTARLQPRNRAFDGLPRLPRVFSGRAEKPYAVAHVRGVRDAGGNLAVSWVRRTRAGGGLLPGTGDVPLGEDAEAYEVEVLSAGGPPAVLRTVAGLSAPGFSYAAADQAADHGGAAPASVRLRVFQLSAQVGRGVPSEATL